MASSSTVKHIIYIFNLLLLICGILMVVLGGVMYATFGEFQKYLRFDIIPMIILVIGCVLIALAIVGCSAAKQESACVLLVYSSSVFVIFLLQLAMVIYVFLHKVQFLNAMGDLVRETWQLNDVDHDYPMHSLQLNFNCCGVQSYEDYIAAGLPVPKSCCGKLQAWKCNQSIYEQRAGCESVFTEFWRWNVHVMGSAGLGVCLVELVAFSLACHMLAVMRKVAKKSDQIGIVSRKSGNLH